MLNTCSGRFFNLRCNSHHYTCFRAAYFVHCPYRKRKEENCVLRWTGLHSCGFSPERGTESASFLPVGSRSLAPSTRLSPFPKSPQSHVSVKFGMSSLIRARSKRSFDAVGVIFVPLTQMQSKVYKKSLQLNDRTEKTS